MPGIGDIVRIFEEIELRLVRSLKRNLMRHKDEEKKYDKNWSAWQAEKLRSLEAFRRENAAMMSEYTEQIDDATREIMQEQFDEGVNGGEVPEAVPVKDTPAEVKPEPQFFGVDKTKVNKLIEDVTDIEKNAETAALRMTDDVYRTTVNRVQLAMSTGSMTLQQAVDIAVKDFLDQGINCIVYKDGRRVHIADYVRMVLRTTSTRAALQGKSEKHKALGYDTVAVSSYGMCSPTCLPYQGRVYINDAFTDWVGETESRADGMIWGKSHYCGKWFPLLSSAIKGGLFHPNCRHSITLWRDGDPLPKQVDNTETERRYKLEQQQRAMERNIRRLKRYAEGSTEPASAKAYRKELKEAQDRLKVFVGEHSEFLRRDPGKEKSSAAELTEEERKDLNKPYTDVTQEYLDNATPGEGEFTVDEGCKDKRYKKEVDFADWLHKTLGGNIHVYEEKHEYEGQKNPDYLWNGKIWDLKSPKNEEGANSLIRKGMRQIVENPGGIMLDYEDKDISFEKLQRIIDKRMEWVHDKTVDIMIVRNGKIIRILRYKK